VYYLKGDSYRLKDKEAFLKREDSEERKQNQSDVSPGKKKGTKIERRPMGVGGWKILAII